MPNMSRVTKALEAKYDQLMQMADEAPEQVFPTLVRIIEPLVDVPNGISSKKWLGNPKAKNPKGARGWRDKLKASHDLNDSANWKQHITQAILASQGLGVLHDIGPKGHLNRFESVEAREVASLISEDANSSYRLTKTQLRIKALVESYTGWTVVPLREVI
jgi:hypothetical protein